MFACAALRQLVAEQIKGGKLAEPADGVSGQQTSPLCKAGTVVKAGHRLPGWRVGVFRVALRTHKKTSLSPFYSQYSIAVFLSENEIWGELRVFWGEIAVDLHKKLPRRKAEEPKHDVILLVHDDHTAEYAILCGEEAGATIFVRRGGDGLDTNAAEIFGHFFKV